MRYELFGDRILVRTLESRRTAGGLWIPESSLDNTPWLLAEVIAVGHGRLTQSGTWVPLWVKEGDIIRFFRTMQAGNQLVVPLPDDEPGEEKGLVIREEAVLMRIHDLKQGSDLVGSDGKPLVLQ